MAGFQPYLNANRNTKKPIIHISLNPHPDDVLNREQYADLAADYMERMGYGQQPYVVFLHEDIDRKHIHIISTRVNAEGVKIAHAYERRRSNEIRLALEKEYGLKPAAYRENTTLPLKKIDYQRGNIKVQAGSVVISALEQYRFSTFGEFNALLKCFNLTAWEVRGVVGPDEKPYRGLMYGALDDEGDRIGNPIKAIRIGNYAGLRNIEKICAGNREYLTDLYRRKALAGRIRKVLAECRSGGNVSQGEIERRLLERGISAVFRYNDDGRLIGATFIDHREKNVYNGSALGKDLSANSWYALFSEEQPLRRPLPEVEAEQRQPAQTHTPAVTPIIDPDAGDEIIKDVPSNEPETVPQGERSAIGISDADYRTGHDIFRGLAYQGRTYEEIDPEFRSLYKLKKKRKGRKR